MGALFESFQCFLALLADRGLPRSPPPPARWQACALCAESPARVLPFAGYLLTDRSIVGEVNKHGSVPSDAQRSNDLRDDPGTRLAHCSWRVRTGSFMPTLRPPPGPGPHRPSDIPPYCCLERIRFPPDGSPIPKTRLPATAWKSRSAALARVDGNTKHQPKNGMPARGLPTARCARRARFAPGRPLQRSRHRRAARGGRSGYSGSRRGRRGAAR